MKSISFKSLMTLMSAIAILSFWGCAKSDGDKDESSSDSLPVTEHNDTSPPPPSALPSTLKKTGQTTVYKAGDDGTYQIGVATSYTRDDTKEIVTDNVTGLMWQDDTEAETVNRDWAGADAYCTALSLGTYDDWRVPTIDELMYIADRSRAYPAIDFIFRNAVSHCYWSSTTVVGHSGNAWIVAFGDSLNYWPEKNYCGYVRCVRGESNPVANRFTRDDTTGIVTDGQTYLQWQDDEDAKTVKKNWADAIDHCEGLSLGGYDDWRLPNFNELYYLVYRDRDPSLSPVFENASLNFCWSSTTVVGEDYAWGVPLGDGPADFNVKSSSENVLCTRGGQ